MIPEMLFPVVLLVIQANGLSLHMKVSKGVRMLAVN
jgi:hypothetical protein